MKSRAKSAFTLVEVIVIFVVIAVLAVVFFAAPKTGLIDMYTRNAANMIKSDIRYAQSYALSSQKKTRVSFDITSDSYSVYYEQSAGSWVLMKDSMTGKDMTKSLSGSGYSGVDIAQTNFNGTNNGLVFYSSGSPYSYASGTMAALSSQGVITLSGGVTVTVEPSTGKVL